MAEEKRQGLLGRARGKLAKWKSGHRPAVPGGPAPRIVLRLPVEITGYEKQITASSENIAMGGMLLRADGPLSVGEPVQVGFELPDGPRINIPAVVCRDHRPMLAIKFDVTDNQRELIRRWVEAHLRSAS